MATFKVSYLFGDSFSNKGEFYVNNVYDEHDAVELGLYQNNLMETNIKIMSVDLISE